MFFVVAAVVDVEITVVVAMVPNCFSAVVVKLFFLRMLILMFMFMLWLLLVGPLKIHH